MTKVPNVPGVATLKFHGVDIFTNGTSQKLERKVYNFPKREAMLMAMSYSYELQAQVFDAWEVSIKNVYLPSDYLPLPYWFKSFVRLFHEAQSLLRGLLFEWLPSVNLNYIIQY